MCRRVNTLYHGMILIGWLLASCSRDARVFGAITPPVQSSQATYAALPAGYQLVNNDSIHLAFALPQGWTSTSGTAPHAVYSEYGPPDQGSYPTFRAAADSETGLTSSAESVISPMKSAITSGSAEGIRLVDDYHLPLGGQEAYVLEYILSRSPSESYFSIIAAVLSADGRGYMLQWTATGDAPEDARTLFRNMVPFFRFLE
jgi:hypothetical protein